VTLTNTTGARLLLDLPEEDYHADPALSSTGARRLLTCPALYRYEQDNPAPPRDTFDFGHAAHAQVLGVGLPIVVGDFTDWRTKAAQAWRDGVRQDGGVPLLTADAEKVAAMADALRTHPLAGALLTPGEGTPESSIFWTDPTWGIDRRARIDWTRPGTDGGRVILADYKTTTEVSPAAISRTVAAYGYHQQAAWYRDAAAAADLDDDAVFLFVFQAKTAPYLVHVVELDALALRVGADLNERALQVYAQCTASGRWPGYNDDVTLLGLPAWALSPAALDPEVTP
jgi:hypothetical protein